MANRFHPTLVNDPLGDPGVFVRFLFERRAILFDLGDLAPLPPRKLLRVTDVFVSHMHLDHFCGLDRLLRLFLGREATLRLYGPAGLIAAVGHKLAAYTWNLVGNYSCDFILDVREVAAADRLSRALFRTRAAFAREDMADEPVEDGVLLAEPGFAVRFARLDHGIPCLAFALEERAHVNVLKTRVQALGLAVGPWLRDFKAALLRGEPDDFSVAVAWTDNAHSRPDVLPLGRLRGEIAAIVPGQKIGYVVDTGHSAATVARIVDLVGNADVLFIEAPFLHHEAERARDRRHLTARQAGEIARAAGVSHMTPFHFSPRYQDEGAGLAEEADAAFRGAWGSGHDGA